MISETQSVKWAGREWNLTALTVKDLGEIQEWVYSKLPDPLEVAKKLAEGQDPSVVKELLLNAYEDIRHGARKLGSPESTAVLNTVEGLCKQLLIRGRKNHPEMTFDDWAEVVEKTLKDEADELNKLSGEDQGGVLPDPKKQSSSKKGKNH
jgi:hypothetical protein